MCSCRPPTQAPGLANAIVTYTMGRASNRPAPAAAEGGQLTGKLAFFAGCRTLSSEETQSVDASSWQACSSVSRALKKCWGMPKDQHLVPLLSQGHRVVDVTLPPTSIQPEGDSGGWFGRFGRGERRGLARSWSLSGAADPVAG